MSDFLKELFSALLTTSPFLLACLAIALPNLEQKERAHQFTMPILAIIYCIPVLLFTRQMGELLETLLTYLIGIFTLLPFIGRSIYSWLNNLANTINNSVNTELLYNICIAIVFLIIKAIARPIVRRTWKNHTFLCRNIAARFYWKWDTKSILQQKFGDMRRMFKAFYIAVLLLGWLDCALIQYGLWNSIFPLPFYPVFAIMLLGEAYFYLNGKTADEYGIGEGGYEEENEVPCGEILDALRNTFPDRIGFSDQRAEPVPRNNPVEWEEMLENGDNLDKITCTYFNNLKRALPEIESDYVIAADKLMHGESVLIYNPFYRDMTDYLLLPIFHALLNHKSCLIICGRSTNEKDIQEWIRDGITEVTDLPKLWNIEVLDGVPDDNAPAHIGILGFRRIFDMENLRENQDFFRKTELVIMLEPSNLLGTGQIGLRSVLQFCEQGDRKPTYCILDRNADGLVDALSHVVRHSITEVVAAPAQKSRYCRAFWRAEGPGMQTRILKNISHYLGIGGEISTLAVHEGAKIMHWYSGDKMPLIDLRWNTEQYVEPICRYLSIPGNQLELDKRFHYHESLWQADFGPRSFVVVEDEFCNAFEMERAFGARIRQRGFVNILSESYMLRDYMYDNNKLFTNDPKAIPSIVPDYARTERNLVLRTLMLMAIQPIEEAVLSEELALHGIETTNARRTFVTLVKRHTDLRSPKIHTIQSGQGKMGIAGYTRFAYSIDQAAVNRIFDSALRIAYFVIENEQTKTYQMGNRLMGHVDQALLPGQFFCYDGKYYQVRSISNDNGIVVRRAADHLNGRIYYRQLRHYKFEEADFKELEIEEESPLLAEVQDEIKNVRGIRMFKLFANIQVHTPGYLEYSVRNDLPRSDYVELDDDNVRNRTLKNKELLRLELNDTTPEIRFTLCALLNELFQTVYPNDYHYITAVMPDVPDNILAQADYPERIATVVFPAEIAEPYENSIYIIEDSNIDLGLLVSFERNFQRFMEILADYLDWYQDPDRKSKGKTKPGDDDDASDGSSGSGPDGSSDSGSDGSAGEGGDSHETADDKPSDAAENAAAEGSTAEVDESPEKKTAEASEEQPEENNADHAENTAQQNQTSSDSGADSADSKTMADRIVNADVSEMIFPDADQDDVDGEDEELLGKPRVVRQETFKHFEYLTFGYGETGYAEWLAIPETLQYLTAKSFLNSNLHRAHGTTSGFDDGSDYDPTTPGTHYCDFCGAAMEKNHYVVLKDGRERCPACSKDAIRTKKQFKQVYSETLEEMKNTFDITFDQPLKIRMANAKKVNEGIIEFKPSPRFDARVLGYAQGYTIYVENGAPRWKTKQTLVHELTHVWQHANWDQGYMARYGSDTEVTTVMEGMAVWAEIQYLLSMGQKDRAIMYKRNRDYDTSVYGTGMKRYINKYPPKEIKSVPKKKGPFGKFPPI